MLYRIYLTLSILMATAILEPVKGYSNLAIGAANTHSEKMYIEPSRLYFSDEGIFLKTHFDEWTPIGDIHHDAKGFYLNNATIIEYGSRVSQEPKKWKCPYCNHWWIMGEECRNEECPTNQWARKNKEES